MAMPFIKASKSSDCRTGLVRHAEISRARQRAGVVGLAGGRQQQQPDVGDRWLAADLLGQLEPVHPGHHSVDQGDRDTARPGRAASQLLQSGGPAVDGNRPGPPIRRGLLPGSGGWWHCRPRSRPAALRAEGTSGSPQLEPSCGCKPSLTVNQKVLPTPGSLSTQMRPPISSTSLAEIVSPSPVPPNRRVVDPSACSNGWKIVCTFSAGMPMPGVGDGERAG